MDIDKLDHNENVKLAVQKSRDYCKTQLEHDWPQFEELASLGRFVICRFILVQTKGQALDVYLLWDGENIRALSISTVTKGTIGDFI